MRIEVVESLSGQQWDQWLAFLARSDHGHPEQDPRFAEGWRALGDAVFFVMGWQGSDLVAVAMFRAERHPLFPGSFRRADAMSGPVCDDPGVMIAFLDRLQATAPFNRMGMVRVTPYWLGDKAAQLSQAFAAAGWSAFEPPLDRKVGISDISGTPEDIAARFSPNARRKLRRVRELGLEIDYIKDETTALEAFHLLGRHLSARDGGSVEEAAFLANFRNVYATDDLGALFLVRNKGRVVAGAMNHRSHDTIHFTRYFIDDEAAAELGRIRVAPLVAMETMTWANARGCTCANWGNYAKGVPKSHPYHGVFQYKSEFLPTEMQRFQGHQKLFRPAIYKSGNAALRARKIAKPLVAPLRDMVRNAR